MVSWIEVIWVMCELNSCSMLSTVIPSNPYDSLTIIRTRSFRTKEVFCSFSKTGKLAGLSSGMLSTYLSKENNSWKEEVIFARVAESALLIKSMISLVLFSSYFRFWKCSILPSFSAADKYTKSGWASKFGCISDYRCYS